MTPTPRYEPPLFLRVMAMLPMGIAVIALVSRQAGGGLIGGAIWGGLGGAFAGVCIWLARRQHWPLVIRTLAMLNVIALAYGVLVSVMLSRSLPPAALQAMLPAMPIMDSSWREFALPGGGCKVMMPGAPALQKVEGNQQEMQLYTLDLPASRRAFAIGRGEVSLEDWKRMPLSMRFEGARDGMLFNTPGSDVEAEIRLAFQGHPGREFHLDLAGKGKIIARCYAINRRIYTLVVAGSDITPTSPEVRRFFDSFQPDLPRPEDMPGPGDRPPDWDDEDTNPDRIILDDLTRPNGPRELIHDVQFLSHGRLLVASEHRGLVIWEIADRKVIDTLRAGGASDRPEKWQLPTTQLALAPDGVTLAVATSLPSPCLELYDLRFGKLRCKLTDPEGDDQDPWQVTLAFSPDGRWLASSQRHHLKIWDVATGQLSRRLSWAGSGQSLTFTPDGRSLIVLGSSIQFLDPLSGGVLRRLPYPNKDEIWGDGPLSLALSADGARLITGGLRGGVYAWDVATGRHQTLRESGPPVSRAAMVPSGKLMATADEHFHFRVYDATGRERLHLDLSGTSTDGVPTLKLSPDGRQMALAHGRRLEVWDLEKVIKATPAELASKAAPQPAANPQLAGNPLYLPFEFEAHPPQDRVQFNAITNILVANDNRAMITVSLDMSARAWDLATKQPLGEPLPLVGHPKGAALRSDGQAFVIAAQEAFNRVERVYMADLPAGGWADPLAILRKEGPGSRSIYVSDLAFTADGKTLAVALDRQLELWSWDDLSVRRLGEPAFEIHCLAMAPDGAFIAIGGKQAENVHLVDTETGKVRFKLPMSRDGVHSVAISPDGKLVAAASEYGPLVLWDAATGKKLRTITPRPTRERSLAFSPDSAWLAAGDAEGKARIWTCDTGEEVTAFTSLYRGERPAWITCLTFSRDGNLLFAGTGDGIVHRWPLTAFRQRK